MQAEVAEMEAEIQASISSPRSEVNETVAANEHVADITPEAETIEEPPTENPVTATETVVEITAEAETPPTENTVTDVETAGTIETPAVTTEIKVEVTEA